MSYPPASQLSNTLTNELIALRTTIEQESQRILAQYCPDDSCLQQSNSAKNLGHYLALRRHDLRQIQDQLAEAGVSSLGRCEAHVMHTLNQVINILQHDVDVGVAPGALYGIG